MWPSQFEYHRASSVEEALSLLAANQGAKFIAGGHSLLPAMKLRLNEPSALIDIGRIAALKTISVSGDNLEIGALATHHQISTSADVAQHCPALASAAGEVGDHQVRNWGTLGGNIAHADPASDPPTVLVAAGATIHVQGAGGKRAIPAADFFQGLFTTDLQDGEIITKVTIPSQAGRTSAYAKMSHPASRYAVVGVCVILEMDGKACKSARVGVGGAVPSAQRSGGAEAALAGSSLDDVALEKAADALKADLGDTLMGDLSYPDDYRREMAGVYLKRAVQAALG